MSRYARKRCASSVAPASSSATAITSSSFACRSPNERSCWITRLSRVTGCIGGKIGCSVNQRVTPVADDLRFVLLGRVDLLGRKVGARLQTADELGDGA